MLTWGQIRAKHPELAAKMLHGGAEQPPDSFEFDGASVSLDYFPVLLRSGWRLWLVRVPIVVPAGIHDWHYSEAKPLGFTLEARRRADELFRINILIAARFVGVGDAGSDAIAWLYAGRVRVWGEKAWLGGVSVWRRIWNVWTGGEG